MFQYLGFGFIMVACSSVAAVSAFEDFGVYSMRSTTSALIIGMKNDTPIANAPVLTQSVTGSLSCKQHWEAIESQTSPGFFFLRGEQNGESSTPLVLDLIQGALYHTEDERISRQRWAFEPICSTGSGLIRNERYNTLCLLDNGMDRLVTSGECDMANGAMLWKLDKIESGAIQC